MNFMMLPLWTSVTLLRLCLMAYSMAAVDEPLGADVLTGLMPMPTCTCSARASWSRRRELPCTRHAFSAVPKRILLKSLGNSLARKSRTFCASGVPPAYSMPA